MLEDFACAGWEFISTWVGGKPHAMYFLEASGSGLLSAHGGKETLNTELRMGSVTGDPLLVLPKKYRGHVQCGVAGQGHPVWPGPHGHLVPHAAPLVTMGGDSIDVSPHSRGIS